MPKSKKTKLKIRSKVWLELNGLPFFGQGRLTILCAIDRHGSMIKAAEETNISYRRIRGIIREMEEQLGRALVVSCRGGKLGGWTAITNTARDLIHRFEKQQAGLHNEIDKTFERLFGDYP
ncbi:hypothetical protein DSCO28_16120 [Desulfosarcina ovata subsp. sediminis]|uniref:HTH lysR-type domain-containing protein n=1 Tax=Desulfosarcina ovata subsp. sediminis TaxID=885957 RepID=A0A5K7ZJ76_9BACT|nr:LysR family transcriptional regulator [Desulfosarcina ovata]BBO81046.1 hypothetical protein DSCO28_16120 [Desulfosarcina ovata subsp. sediminis]